MIVQVDVNRSIDQKFHYFLFKLSDQRVYIFGLNENGLKFEEKQEQDDNDHNKLQSYANNNEKLTIDYINEHVIPHIPQYNQIFYNSVDFINDVISRLQEEIKITLYLIEDYCQLIPIFLIVALGKFQLAMYLLAGLIIFFTGQVYGHKPSFDSQTFMRSMTFIKKYTWQLLLQILNHQA